MYTVTLFVKPVADARDVLSNLNLRISPERHCLAKDHEGPGQIYSTATNEKSVRVQVLKDLYFAKHCFSSAACSLLKESMHRLIIQNLLSTIVVSVIYFSLISSCQLKEVQLHCETFKCSKVVSRESQN